MTLTVMTLRATLLLGALLLLIASTFEVMAEPIPPAGSVLAVHA